MIIKRKEGKSNINILKDIRRNYKKDNITKEWLLSNGFRFNRLFSDEESEVYTYRFPVYKYDGFSVLDCELKIMLGGNKVLIDVYDYNTINRYAPFYYREYGSYDKILEEIWKKINKVVRKLDIMEDKE